MNPPDYEKLGVFYLGREFDPGKQELGGPLLYDSRDLTTHALCIGMTGSGKTGLCIGLLEEAALDGVPAIVIDPKGDLGNLLLTFPDLAPSDFQPWVDAGEAARNGKSVEELAQATADAWRKGLAEWNEDADRIRRLRAAAEFALYTPGSDAGRPLSVLRSFAAPDSAMRDDSTALNERVSSCVSGLLALIGIVADPIKSREHILLSAILDAAWRAGGSPDLAALIGAIQKPPFDKLGVFDLESFYPAKDRTELALALNSLLAAPGFAAWLTGDALDIQQLLHAADGRPRIAIISIAHLNDAERMFVVTLVANELVAWMRRQSGTSSLRAIFYMDEVFGFFPPVAMPPSKQPLLTMMKQARAFGLGVVLATQNPVDLDYKGLGNAGTWFIGRLSTERDQQRVINGLLGTDAAQGLDRTALTRMMANLTQRTFLMRNVHDDAPVLFRTRWALSYLRGPLTLAEIRKLTPAAAVAPAAPGAVATTTAAPPGRTTRDREAGIDAGTARPVVQAGVTERFAIAAGSEPPVYRAHIGALARAHFVDARAGLEAWESWYYLAPIGADGVAWADATAIADPERALADEPARGARFAEAPAAALSSRNHKGWASQLADHVYRNAAVAVLSCPALERVSAPGSNEGEFRAQLAHELRERRDAAVEALRAKYGKRLDALGDRQRRATQKLERERMQATSQTTSSGLAVATSVLGALLGGRRRAFGRAATVARDVGRIGKERTDVTHAEADVRSIEQQTAALKAELAAEVERISAEFDPAVIRVETIAVRPRKSDIEIENLALVWAP